MVEFPLTNPQKRIWQIEKKYPFTSINNIGGLITFKGKVDLNLLETALCNCIKNNDALRIRIVEDESAAYQYFENFSENKIDYFDWTKENLSSENFHEFIDKEFRKPFILFKSPLYYFGLFKLENDVSALFVKFHHIIMDGWSVALFTSQLYQFVLNNKNSGDRKEAPTYKRFIHQELEYLNSDVFMAHKRFWLDRFDDFEIDHIFHTQQPTKGARKCLQIEGVRCRSLKQLLVKSGMSLNSFFSTIFLIYQNRVSELADITIGIPIFNRTDYIDKQTMGMFTSSMPFRVKINTSLSFFDFSVFIKKELTKCYSYQRYPYNILIQDISIQRGISLPLYSASINYYKTTHRKMLGDIQIENDEFYNGNQLYPLQIVIKEWTNDESIQLYFDYLLSKYTEEIIVGMFDCFIAIIDQVIENVQILLKEIALPPYSATRTNPSISKTDLNDTCSLIASFQKQFVVHPDRVAISEYLYSLTYREFNDQMEDRAIFFQENGIKRGDVICISVKHSIECVVLIWAAIRSGAMFVPVDPKLPWTRKMLIFADVNPEVILLDLDVPSEFEIRFKVIDIRTFIFPKYRSEQFTFPELLSSDLAYVIYTSGSTGGPKGVMVSHGNLVNYVNWAAKKYLNGKDEIFAFFSSIGFDLTVTSIFCPLIYGAQIRVYNEANDGLVFKRLIKENIVTVIKLTPSHLKILLNEINATIATKIRVLIVGGEIFKITLAHNTRRLLGESVLIFNEYGPTEATVGCIVHLFDPNVEIGESVSIGAPIDNAQVYVLDNDFAEVPIGAKGELYISGNCIASGYFNDEIMTRKKFVRLESVSRQILYKTGDFVRYVGQNRIEYLGRHDGQVKIRGYRVELKEIERVISSLNGVKECVVVERMLNHDEMYLCAYIILTEIITKHEIRVFLGSLLPNYMMPNFIHFINELPLNLNGKINLVELPVKDKYEYQESDFVEVISDSDIQVVRILKAVLSVNDINTGDSFYYLGGDSIKAIQISSRLFDLGIQLSVTDILNALNIGEILKRATNSLDASGEILEKKVTGLIPNVPSVNWFLGLNLKFPGHYCQSICLEFDNNVNSNTLSEFFKILINRHDSLRINLHHEFSQLFYNEYHFNSEFEINKYDLSDRPVWHQLKLIAEIGTKIKSSFDIYTSLLFSATEFKLETEKKLLCWSLTI